MRLSDWLIRYLKYCGVTRLYQVTGRGSLFISDAMARDADIQVVSMHHEQSAAYAACAQAELEGGLAACVVSSGCATTNAISGVLTAWQDELPVLFISGQNFSSETATGEERRFRTYGEQETDIISIVSPITKKAIMPKSTQECITIMPELGNLALSPRKGPIWLDVPLDVQSARVTDEIVMGDIEEDPISNSVEPSDVKSVCSELLSAKRPLLLIGSSCHSFESRLSIKEFVETTKIPVVFDGSSPDVYGSGNHLSIGSVGSQGCTRSGNFALQNADVVVALGSSLRSSLYGEDPKDFARRARLLLVDVDRKECRIDRVPVDEIYEYPIPTFLNALSRRLPELQCEGWRSMCLRWKEMFPKMDFRLRQADGQDGLDLYDMAEVLSSLMRSDAIFVTDSGLAQLILPTTIKFRDEQRCIQPFSQGAMGFALPAAVGVAAGSPNRQVVVVTGDGSLMMNLQELETIRYHALPLKMFVVSNGAYAIIRKRQVDLFRGRTIGTDPQNGVSIPSIRAIADLFEMNYGLISSFDMMKSDIGAILESPRPSLCEVSGKWNQNYVHVARALDATGRIVERPIDNQSPWLDEDVYRRELQLLESISE